MKISDLRSDSWFQILRAIQRGDRPKDADLHAAFLRGEHLSAEQQRIVAKLFDGSLKRGRGRPRGDVLHAAMRKLHRSQDDFCLFLEVNELVKEMPAKGGQAAFDEAVRKEAGRQGVDARTILRRYRRAQARHIPE